MHFLQLYVHGLHYPFISTSFVYWYLSYVYVDIHVYELCCWQYRLVHADIRQQR